MSFKTIITRHPARIAAWIIILVVIWTNFDLKFWKYPNRLMVWDVLSYYAYLPATVIYHDLTFEFAEKYKNKIGEVIFPDKGPKGFFVIQTSYGLSLLYSPFFLINHGIMLISGGPATGYSPPYKIALIISCIFYLAVGVYFLKKFLLRYFSQWATAITLLAIVLGTNLYHYSSHEALMPHAYNFSLIAVLIYFTPIWYEKTNFRNTLITGFLIGLIALIRPVNLIVLAFFVLWDVHSWDSFRDRIYFLFRSFKWIFLMMLIFIAVWIPQFFYWRFVSGSFFYYPYSDMGFFFNNPQIFSSLFSYRKGLFLYMPLIAVAFLGIPFLFRKFHGLILPVGLFVAVNVYVLSSWCFWWFGGSFGPRSYIDTYAILAIPFAALATFALHRIWALRIPFILVVAALIWFNFFQTRQYYTGAINWSGMTKESYWNSFLKEYPSKEFNSLLRFPNRENAIKGIYYKDDLTYDDVIPPKKEENVKKVIETPEFEKFIKKFEKTVRHYDDWFDKVKEKALKSGISVDSMIRKDAIWYYEEELKRISDSTSVKEKQ